MCGDADVGAIPQEFLQDVNVVAIDGPHIVVCDFTGLGVDAFAEPVIGPEILQVYDIINRSSQVRLDDHTDI